MRAAIPEYGHEFRSITWRTVDSVQRYAAFHKAKKRLDSGDTIRHSIKYETQSANSLSFKERAG